MAESTCVKCGSTSFEMVEANSIKGTDLKKKFIQCASCGGVVGVADFYNVQQLVLALGEKLGHKLV